MQTGVLFAFRDDTLCFIHVLPTALDMKARGFEAGIVLEGAATRLVTVLGAAQHPMHALYVKARGQGLFHGACRACSLKMVVLEQVQAAGLATWSEATTC